jgi:hypothetical protein
VADVADEAEPPPELWYASATAKPRRLLDVGDGTIAVDPMGDRIAWRNGSMLTTARVVDGALERPAETAVPAGVEPEGFIGDSVRVANRQTGRQTTWYPGDRYFAPDWRSEVAGVYGALPDGYTLIGLTRPENQDAEDDAADVVEALDGAGAGVPGTHDAAAERCLARFDAASLRATKIVCGLHLTPEARGWVSPGGRWLVAEVAIGGGTRAALIDLSAVFAGDTRTVPVAGAPTGGAAWENPDTVVRASQGALQRLRLDRLWAGKAGGVENLVLAGVHAGAAVIVVTRVPS